ncbi:ubiquitin-like-specific protease 1D isoform X2 [Impatiens glandulifera]|uniref:ubiquitin-like-specific protease 1D isoform X2 n=1 Tax=Impatiens glandulifera TaxID=253017 RepID=UPI001FB18059|nr:ubiquitin-like-specific protease 1D isoform X2 [Impatiens glandulifera]
MEEERAKKKGLQVVIDWEKILSNGDADDDEPLPTLIVSGKQQQQQQHSPMACDRNHQLLQDDETRRMEDSKLDEAIERCRSTIETLKLPDGGAKLKLRLKLLQDEKDRRKLQKDIVVRGNNKKPLEIPTSNHHHPNSNSLGTSLELDVPRQQQHTSSTLPPPPRSSFAAHFTRKLDHEECRTIDAYQTGAHLLTRCQLGGDQTSTSSTRKSPFQCPTALSANIASRCNGNRRPQDSSEKLSTSVFKRKKNSEVKLLKDKKPRNGQTVVLVDEEEPQLEQSAKDDDKMDVSLKERNIYYPTRDDPESVEIRYSDMACLAPAAFLSSSIMNFYIRYLQTLISPTAGPKYDFHFFNTYFYKKLKAAVLNQADQEKAFVKLRRWWKGVNIFMKSYILIPIHEDLHWSLVIICILDKEDESGPIILHLDSLGLHFSSSICSNIKFFLREEWKCLNQGEAPLDLPILDRIWKYLPRRIEEKPIAVPQQRNDYDCGLFVLYFMERLIDDAPQRLRKKDLAMFGKKWFRPEEASGLRTKIKKLLLEQFQLQDDSSNNNNIVDSLDNKEPSTSTSTSTSPLLTVIEDDGNDHTVGNR